MRTSGDLIYSLTLFQREGITLFYSQLVGLLYTMLILSKLIQMLPLREALRMLALNPRMSVLILRVVRDSRIT